MHRRKHRAGPLAICAAAMMLVAAPTALLSQAANGTTCWQVEGFACRTRLVTEATLGFRLAGGANGRNEFGGAARYHVAMNAGFVAPIASRVGLGVVATVGIWDDFYAAVGPRLRYHVTNDVAVDVTPQWIIKRGQPDAKRALLDVSAMHRDRIGLSVQLASFQQSRYGPDFPEQFDFRYVDTPALFAGIRLGSKPGRFGMIAEAIALGGAFVLYAVACASSGCD